MLKVMWFLKRAEGITLEEFDAWWREHLQMIADRQRPQLLRYTVNIRTSDTDELAGHTGAECEWDGVAEQWVADEAAFVEVYGRPAASHTRSDTLAHVSRFERLFVHEINVIE
ncbi:MAG: EthD domain-containing protein [Actinomycetales bacterium]